MTGWEHLPCIAHTLNLIVPTSLDAIQDSLIEKIKCIADHFHRSSLATSKLLKLKIDLMTRWNSTVDMLERMTVLQEPLKATLCMLHNTIENLLEDEWQALSEIVSDQTL